MRTWISKILQTLSSGLIIRQSISDAVRPVFFQTDIEDFLYGTHGGTTFVVNFRGRVYALTCGHVFKEFDHGKIFITAEKQAKAGSPRPEIKAVYYPSSPRDAAIGTDVVDICVIEFTDDIGPDFFKGSAYVIDDNTVATSRPGHALLVSGVLKDWTTIFPEEIRIGYCRLQFLDAGVFDPDPVLRRAVSEFHKPKFQNITGISGSPVFDQTANVLCGMVARGSMTDSNCEIKYIDIYDVIRVLEAISAGLSDTKYKKLLYPSPQNE